MRTNIRCRALYVGEGAGTYTVDREHARGGYRYLSLINNGTDEIVLTGLSVYFTAAPTQDLQSSYTGYFHTNDELINRVWYAGAYTNREYIPEKHKLCVPHTFKRFAGYYVMFCEPGIHAENCGKIWIRSQQPWINHNK